MFEFLFQILGGVGVLFTAFVGYNILRKQKAPVTKAHRLAKARVLWSVLTREDKHVALFEQR